LLLIVLWVRSYSTIEYVTGPISKTSSFDSFSAVGYMNAEIMFQDLPWNYEGMEVDANASERWANATRFGFALGQNSRGMYACAPHWFAVLSFATLAAAPWLPYSFSLRTLLIAATVVAVGLGLIVWAVK
jgi:hypothetical protein